MTEASGDVWPSKHGTPDLSGPNAYEKYRSQSPKAAYQREHPGFGHGLSYVEAIETALERGTIDLADVQGRFKDYKNSKCAKEYLKDASNRPEPSDAQKRFFKNYERYFTEAAGQLAIPPGDSDAMIRFEAEFKLACKGYNFDCDGSSKYTPKEAVLLYGLLWSDAIQIRRRQREWIYAYRSEDLGAAGGDVKNSFGSMFCACMGMREDGVEKALEKYAEASKTSEDKDMFDQLALLAYLTHTAGNFIPMPSRRSGPNQTHGYYHGTDGVRDRWDLFLSDIRVWYRRRARGEDEDDYEGKTVDGKASMRFAERKGEPFYCWLCSYVDPDGITKRDLDDFPKSFERFIKKNYLDDYVTAGEEGPMVARYEEAPGNAANNTVLAKRLRQMNARIIARGNRMWEAMTRNPKAKEAVEKAINEIHDGKGAACYNRKDISQLADFIFGYGEDPIRNEARSIAPTECAVQV